MKRAEELAEEKFPYTQAPHGEHHISHRARIDTDRYIFTLGYAAASQDALNSEVVHDMANYIIKLIEKYESILGDIEMHRARSLIARYRNEL